MLRINIEVTENSHRLRQIEELIVINRGEPDQEVAVPYEVIRNGAKTGLTVFHNRDEGALALAYRVMEGLNEELVAAEEFWEEDKADPFVPDFGEEDPERPAGMRFRVLHVLPIGEGFAYEIDDGSQEVAAGTKRSVIEILDAGAVRLEGSSDGPAYIRVLDMAGVRVFFEGVTL